jgi:hypothetical protein
MALAKSDHRLQHGAPRYKHQRIRWNLHVPFPLSVAGSFEFCSSRAPHGPAISGPQFGGEAVPPSGTFPTATTALTSRVTTSSRRCRPILARSRLSSPCPGGSVPYLISTNRSAERRVLPSKRFRTTLISGRRAPHRGVRGVGGAGCPARQSAILRCAMRAKGQSRRSEPPPIASVLPNNRTFSASVGMSQKCQTTDEFYSITSSARARRDAGISIPSDLAVLRLMTSANLVGC